MSKRVLLLSSLYVNLTACNLAPQTNTTAFDQDSWCFYGGPIYTAVDAVPTLAAVAVKDGVITAIQQTEPGASWCAANAGVAAQTINLGGNALYPGFTDSHGHLLWIGLREMMVNMTGTASISELQDRLKVAVSNTSEGDTIYGRGWIETHWPEKRFPNRSDLDAIAPNNPVILTRADGHAVVVNSAAITAANITKDTKPPFGGDILKDDSGEPTGMLIDKAMALVDTLIPPLTQDRKITAYRKASEVYTRRGWTNIHSMSVNSDDLPLQKSLAAEGSLTLRVYNSPEIESADDLTALLEFEASDLIHARAIKLYSDGALGSRGAALLSPYNDDPENDGLLLITKDTIMPILTRALKDGIQVNTHAIGDRANRLLLDWYEEAFAAVPAHARKIAEPRWRVEHAQILNLDDLTRFQALGVIPSMQPSHAIGDLHFAVDRIGKDRLAGGYAWRSLIDSGSIIAGGSDAPVEVGDPRIEFYAAVTRKDLSGFSDDNWYDNQKVTRQEALKMFTIWPAYAAFEENKTGSIEVGKAADFTLFEADIMTAPPLDILTTNVIMTIVDGKAVYQK